MVGGKVVGISRTGTNTLLHVRDGWDHCAVRCVERRADTGERVEVRLGDRVWWQGGQVLWTPAGVAASGPRFSGRRARYDIPLPKVGYSH